MTHILDTLKGYSSKLDSELQKQPFLVKLQNQTGIPKVNLVIGAVILLVIFMSFNRVALLLTNVVGIVVPAYLALHYTSDAQKTANSMFYFMMFAALMLVESVLPAFMSVIPMYPFVKVAVLVWMFSPKHRGASLLMSHVAKNLCASLPAELKKHGMNAAGKGESFPLSNKLSASMKTALSTPLDD